MGTRINLELNSGGRRAKLDRIVEQRKITSLTRGWGL